MSLDFLRDHPCPRPWLVALHSARIAPVALFLGRGPRPFEVAVARSSNRLSRKRIRDIWRVRHGGRPCDVLLVVLYASSAGVELAATAGPSQGDPTYIDLPAAAVEAVARRALAAPNRHTARRIVLEIEAAAATGRDPSECVKTKVQR